MRAVKHRAFRAVQRCRDAVEYYTERILTARTLAWLLFGLAVAALMFAAFLMLVAFAFLSSSDDYLAAATYHSECTSPTESAGCEDLGSTMIGSPVPLTDPDILIAYSSREEMVISTLMSFGGILVGTSGVLIAAGAVVYSTSPRAAGSTAEES